MIFIKFFILFLLSISLNSKEMNYDTISLAKIKKLIIKEEQVAKAYKEYVMNNASRPTLISNLTNYLPNGFNTSNLFGKLLSLHPSETYIVNEIPLNIKSTLYDKYYSNENRVYSKAPLSKKSTNVGISFSEKEQYILNSPTTITIDETSAKESSSPIYLLDDRGILHLYDGGGNIVYSFDENLIVYEDTSRTDTDGGISPNFKTILENNNILYPGQQILNIENGIAQEYINIGDEIGIIKVGDSSRDIGKTVIQFTRRAGGMIVNGDIYTWGNNANQIVGLGTNSYTGATGGGRYPVITGLIRAKAKTYNSNIDDKNYFSSPLRPKFVDFFSTVYSSTCGVTLEGAIYCGGSKGEQFSFGSNFTHVLDSNGNLVGNNDPEMLYRSRFFDGVNNKASKIFSNNQIWLILSKEGNIYSWGYDFGSGFSGQGSSEFNYPSINRSKDPVKINVNVDGISTQFVDITYLLTIGYRRMAALSKDGDIYIWGKERGTITDTQNASCFVDWGEETNLNICKPTKIISDITFKSIRGGLESFLAVSTNDKFYKIYQDKSEKPVIQSVSDIISKESTDTDLLSVDFSTKLGEGVNSGIVWVNSKNELKGDYFTSENVNDDFFKEAIAKIKWKKIKVIQDDNGMCGIDIYNQMYCWGKMSFNRSYDYKTPEISNMGNTFMLPVFNTNLYDLKKDFLVTEGGQDSYLTKMTSGDWNPSGNDFFIKYPTYIGGFNYEFIFK